MVYAIDDNFSDLHSGEQYLLFLDYIPKTGAYGAYTPAGYQLSRNGLSQLSLEKSNYIHTFALDRMDKDTLLRTTRAAAAQMQSQPNAVNCKGQRR
jgi:hypothetical protein